MGAAYINVSGTHPFCVAAQFQGTVPSMVAAPSLVSAGSLPSSVWTPLSIRERGQISAAGIG